METPPLYKESHGEDKGEWTQVALGEILIGHQREIFDSEDSQPLE